MKIVQTDRQKLSHGKAKKNKKKKQEKEKEKRETQEQKKRKGKKRKGKNQTGLNGRNSIQTLYPFIPSNSRDRQETISSWLDHKWDFDLR